MALTDRIVSKNVVLWVFDSLPSNLVREGIQPGDFVLIDTNLKIMNDDHSLISLATPGGPGSVVSGEDAIAELDTTHVITHDLHTLSTLVGAYCNWNSGQPYIIAFDADTITVAFPNECPLSSGGLLTWSVV